LNKMDSSFAALYEDERVGENWTKGQLGVEGAHVRSVRS
jgi:hypothetical protein